MTFRPARFSDTLRLVELLEEQHGKSRYATLGHVDSAAAHKVLARCIQRHGGCYDGSTLVNVVEAFGVVEAFCVGALQRVYMIGDRLEAVDVFLVASPRAPKTAFRRLLNAYLAWGKSNHRVIETMLSHTDALPTGTRMARTYAQLGFSKSGEMWRLRHDPIESKEAA